MAPKEKPNKEELTHIKVKVSDKEYLEKVKNDEGYASIAVALTKELAKRGKKQ